MILGSIAASHHEFGYAIRCPVCLDGPLRHIAVLSDSSDDELSQRIFSRYQTKPKQGAVALVFECDYHGHVFAWHFAQHKGNVFIDTVIIDSLSKEGRAEEFLSRTMHQHE